MISEDVRARVRRLYFAEHWKIGTIAVQLGLHRDTVASAVDTSRFSNNKFRGQALILDPYGDFIRATVEQYPRLRATRLLEMLRGRGYAGSVFPLRRYVRLIRPVPIRESFFRLSTLPGEEAQVDWGSFGKIRVGGDRESPMNRAETRDGWRLRDRAWSVRSPSCRATSQPIVAPSRRTSVRLVVAPRSARASLAGSARVLELAFSCLKKSD